MPSTLIVPSSSSSANPCGRRAAFSQSSRISLPIAFRRASLRYIPSPMNLLVYAPGWAIWDGERLRCALGRGGIRADKREGDGATPAGSWPMRRLLYRPDRLPAPAAPLAAHPLAPHDRLGHGPPAPLH